MPPALAELRASHPEADVAMRVVEDAEALDALRRGELDVAMVLDSELMPLELPAGIEAVPVLDDPLLIALPYSHPLAARSAISLADLRDDEWMVCGVGGTCIDSNVVLRACDAAGFEPRITFESEDYSAIMGMVASGMGVALIPSLALVSAREDIAIRPLRDARPVRRVRAAFAVDRPSALADALLDDPAPGRARAPVGGTAARPRRRLTLRPPRGAAPRRARRRRPASAAAGRAARACTRSSVDDRGGVLERVGDDGAGVDRRGGQQPAVDLGRRTARRWGCGASPARRGARATAKSSAAAWRMVTGASASMRRVGTGSAVAGEGPRRATGRGARRRWSLNMNTFWAATGPAHIGRMVPVRGLRALPAARDPLRRKTAYLQGDSEAASQRATAAWSVSTRARTGHVARWSLTSPQACIPA